MCTTKGFAINHVQLGQKVQNVWLYYIQNSLGKGYDNNMYNSAKKNLCVNNNHTQY